MTSINIDWSAIRPLNGSRAEGFEELCARLADAERPQTATFERNGPPDGGVECYATLRDGTEWGWQAKYWDNLADSQWPQLDDSVKKALAKYPRLVRYYVCTRLNRSDARVDRRRSAKDRWNDHVRKWSGWAKKRGMDVEFVYWGSYELLQRLERPQHVGLVRFWFNVQGFDREWFASRLEEAIASAGPRYTPDLHIDLPISDEIAAFGRTETFFNKIKSLAISLRKALGRLSLRQKADEPQNDIFRNELTRKINDALHALGALNVQPTGQIPLAPIVDLLRDAEERAEKFGHILLESERQLDVEQRIVDETKTGSRSKHNRFRDMRINLSTLTSELVKTREKLEHASAIANSTLMILKGAAGTGKTHLLCDASRLRFASNQPTILFMGHRLRGTEDPWTQMLRQIDLPGITATEFVGCLEAVAQSMQCRALVIVDAINEGEGRRLWPAHLPAFLTALRRSNWISVLLSVRSSYEDILITEAIQNSACRVTHLGFADHEYDATRAFFLHYGLELPSTPMLAPEFRNPLFLKSLCIGLQKRGERRMPRGFQGISSVLDLYLDAVNDRLALNLDFDPKTALTRQALEALAREMAESGQRWLPASKAANLVDALLPNRGFANSLSRGLVIEGVLIEEAGLSDGPEREEVVFIAYDRFADHLTARALLDEYLISGPPAAAFAADAGLGFLSDAEQFVAPGLLEAFCIQVPERTGQELVTLAPKVVEQWSIGAAFRQSLIWRDIGAFAMDTWEIACLLNHDEYDVNETLEVIVTASTIPNHPLNADFLNGRLRQDCMADRDSWWSQYLHSAWGEKGGVDRLVDWAWSVKRVDQLDATAVDLCATTLSWMFTTSNRYLRDRATKAAVNLLTGRIDSVLRLIERFADVDDPYVSERIYAVAYGVAMRSFDTCEIGRLADSVYDKIFASGQPPPQILLRDYARGVIERALWLGADLKIQADLIRPPYGSEWPHIPTEEELEPFQADWSRGSCDSGKTEWARNSIGESVMRGDFARYVIGTNFSFSDWLSLRLEEPAWRSPEQRLATLLPQLSTEEREAWAKVEAAEGKRQLLERTDFLSSAKLHSLVTDMNASIDADVDVDPQTITAKHSKIVMFAEQQLEQALEELRSVLRPENGTELYPILDAMRKSHMRQTPYFDLSIIQRYVLQRVFDLGWTSARFERFDRFHVRSYGREATKAERIGKKYQWIAYHEIMALIADHFQYQEKFREDGDPGYCGPWQDSLRDIDPSCMLRATPGGTSWGGHSPAWWATPRFQNWGEIGDRDQWIARDDDLPDVKELLRVTNPGDGSCWLNLDGYFKWDKGPPPDQERFEVEQRCIWFICLAYLVRLEDADAFMSWANDVDFSGRWMPEPPELYRMFLGEHSWSPAARYFRQPYYGDPGWSEPRQECPVKVRTFATEYICEGRGFDCSIDEGFTLRLPDGDFIRDAGLRWSGDAADYVDACGKLATTDPAAHAAGPGALLVREDVLNAYLTREGLTVCWSIIGEKQVIGPTRSVSRYGFLRISGAYRYNRIGLSGSLKCMQEGNHPDNSTLEDPPSAT